MKGPAQTDALKLEIIHDGRLQPIDQTGGNRSKIAPAVNSS